MRLDRRSLMGGAAALSGMAMSGALSGMARAAVGELGDLERLRLPEAIGRAEREQRLARAQAAMAKAGIGAVLVEAGPSLDYFTGIQWWRSERLTGLVLPASGAPVIVTPFFEKPSIDEMLVVPLEVRTWNEHDEPLKLVADVARERGATSLPFGMEETNRFFLVDRLRQQLPGAPIVSANPVVRAVRMRKTAAEIALMQAAADITIGAFRHAWPRVREGMTAADMDAMIGTATRALGGAYDGGLVLVGEGTALPHGTREVARVGKGSNVLFDCGCDVHGYQSDISRSFVFGADPTAEQRKVFDQVVRGQQIAMKAAQLGRPAGHVDDAVRAAYTSWGYGPGYALPGLSHRTGHGIGMEGHEPVNLVHGEETPLDVGMCFSNEPGLYLPGKFGIRLEDCFHMTADGPRYFSTPPTSLDTPV